MNVHEQIGKSWVKDADYAYKEGIQGILEELSDEKLIKYLVEVSESKYDNSKAINNNVRKLKQELAKKELFKRLQDK